MEILKIDLENLDETVIQKTANVIKSGGVVVVPTDTVYGLVCDATDETAIRKTFEIKKRDLNKPIGIFVGDISMAKDYATIRKDQEGLLESANTFVLPLLKQLPFQKEAIGIRIPNSQLVMALVDELGFPLVQTSANLSGEPLGNDIKKIIETFSKETIKPDLILDGGELESHKPSKVIDASGNVPRILRD
jgi:L-threonylcarbamoyladenylate synthase